VLYIVDNTSGIRFLNSRYQDKFSDFSANETERLIDIFDRLVRNANYRVQTALPSLDIELLSRASAVAGDLKMGYFTYRSTVSEAAGVLLQPS
jgi:hypothetical protein